MKAIKRAFRSMTGSSKVDELIDLSLSGSITTDYYKHTVGLTWQHQITFEETYNEIPEIAISCNLPEYLTVQATQVTKGGFVALVTIIKALNNGYQINWTATGKVLNYNKQVVVEDGTFSSGSMQKDTTKNFTVTFSEPFTNVPKIILTTNDSYVQPSLLSVNQGGFSVRCSCSYSGHNGTISWNATGKRIIGDNSNQNSNLPITESGTGITNSSGIGTVSFVNTHSSVPKAVVITNLDDNARLLIERKVTKTGFECVSFMINESPSLSGNIQFNWIAIW